MGVLTSVGSWQPVNVGHTLHSEVFQYRNFSADWPIALTNIGQLIGVASASQEQVLHVF